MSHTPRTLTPVDSIWSRRQQRHRWHSLWIKHLEQQTAMNPAHPALDRKPSASDGQLTTDLYEYRTAARLYAEDDEIARQWDEAVDGLELGTRHDLAAELKHFNRVAGRDTAHHGLTSHDIVDPANQQAIADSMQVILSQTAQVAYALAHAGYRYRDLIMVERTHGQPAQASLYGLRLATIASPLIDWHTRADWYMATVHGYKMRPAHGAVGTGADLHRLLTTGYGRKPAAPDWDPISQYSAGVHRRHMMAATRQTYHRVYDLHIAGLLLELAAIATTWGFDRRLEAMLGHGNERRDQRQVGSSAMAHKTNPVLSERVCGLAVTVHGYHQMAARAASSEWLGGDVSGSSTRRAWLPGIFQATSAMLVNWLDAHERWRVNPDAIAADLHEHRYEISTGHWLQNALDRGVARQGAYDAVRVQADAKIGTPPPFTVAGLHLQHAQRVIADVVEMAQNLPS